MLSLITHSGVERGIAAAAENEPAARSLKTKMRVRKRQESSEKELSRQADLGQKVRGMKGSYVDREVIPTCTGKTQKVVQRRSTASNHIRSDKNSKVGGD